MPVDLLRRDYSAALLYEPIHDVTYFCPEAAAAATTLGLRGFWMGYVTFRAAPLGPVCPSVVTSCFYGFHRSRVERALPDAWRLASPEAALAARQESAAAALTRLWGRVGVTSDAVTETAELAWQAARFARCDGRVLAAANHALPRPEGPAAAIWQAVTTLREHRGDGHNAVLVARGIAPVLAHLLKLGSGESDEQPLRLSRNWPPQVWAEQVAEAVAGGWLEPGTHRLTASALREHDGIEQLTDELATGNHSGRGDGWLPGVSGDRVA